MIRWRPLVWLLDWSVRQELTRVECAWIDYMADHPELSR